MPWQEILNAEIDRITARLNALGGEYTQALESVRHYAAGQAESLSAVVGQPGYDEAAVAASHNVALFAALKAVHAGDELDAAARQAWLEGVRTALSVIAQVIVAV